MENACCLLACIAATGIAVLADATGTVGDALLRALADSTAHASVAGIGWGAATWPAQSQSNYIGEVFLSAILASLVDLDHFIAAGSTDLKAARTAFRTQCHFHSFERGRGRYRSWATSRSSSDACMAEPQSEG